MSVGIKETKEAVVGVNEVGLHVARRLKDGFQVIPDSIAFYNDLVNDPDFKSKIIAAWENHQAIPEEVKDLDTGEVVELVVIQASYVPKIIAELVA